MGRKTPAKNIHTSPAIAGAKNIDDSRFQDKEKDDSLKNLILGMKANDIKTKEYRGLWTEETFAQCVADYFEYAYEKNLKPCKAGVRLWLGCSRAQYYDWETKPEKFTYKTDILELASNIIESSYIGRAEKYPTANIFLLKTSHGHIETSKVDVTSNGSQIQSKEDLDDAVSKLGLNK